MKELIVFRKQLKPLDVVIHFLFGLIYGLLTTAIWPFTVTRWSEFTELTHDDVVVIRGVKWWWTYMKQMVTGERYVWVQRYFMVTRNFFRNKNPFLPKEYMNGKNYLVQHGDGFDPFVAKIFYDGEWHEQKP